MNKSIIILFFLLTIVILNSFILPFLAGMLLAIIFLKPYTILNNYKNNPKLNAVLVCGGSFLFLVLPILILVTSGIVDLKDVLKESQPQQFTIVKETVLGYIDKFQLFLESTYSFKIDIKSHIPKALEFLSRHSLHIGEIIIKAIPSLMFNLVITFVSSFFILIYSEQFKNLYLRLIPFPIDQSKKVARIIQKVAESILIASVIAAMLQSLAVGLAIAITPMANITLWVFLAFILSFVPVIGTTPIVLYLLISSWIASDYYSLIVFIIMWGCLGLIDNVLRPLLIGNKANLNPFLAFLAALGGVSIVGFIGLFLGPIIVGVFVEILRSEEAKS